MPGEKLLDILRREGFYVHAPCSGRGVCGKCLVYVRAGQAWEPVQACRTTVQDNMELRFPERERLSAEESFAGELPLRSDTGLSGYGVACDIGTTTVVCQLVDLADGTVLASLGEENLQKAYGDDVISRIQAASEGALPALSCGIRRQLSRMIAALCARAGIATGNIARMSIAANPTMCHLLAGLPPDSLGHAPFAPVSRFGGCVETETLDLPFKGQVYIAPSVSGFVGGDITAGMLASEIDRQDGLTLLVDVGTNGEMVLGQGSRFLCCSTAAGPVFEGAQLTCGMIATDGAISAVVWRDNAVQLQVIGNGPAQGLCGSGVLDATAVLLELGILDETGRMLLPQERTNLPVDAAARLFLLDGSPAFRLSNGVYVTQADIRKLQLGKGAIAAGLRVLLDAWQVEAGVIARVLLAGGFGSHLNPKSAARIGLIPKELLPVTRAVGNAALRGAVLAMVSSENCERLGELAKNTAYLELSGNTAFSEAYIDSMFFPEGAEW